MTVGDLADQLFSNTLLQWADVPTPPAPDAGAPTRVSPPSDVVFTPPAASLTLSSEPATVRVTPRETAIAKLRHWTREGLLGPIGPRHAGTGNHMAYSPDALYEAAVLDVLTSAGISVAAAHDRLLEAMAAVKRELPRWRQEGGPLFLVFVRGRQDTETRVEIARKAPKLTTDDLVITVNLAKLWKAL